MKNLSTAQKIPLPVIPTIAMLAYLIAGVECLMLLYIRTFSPTVFGQPHWGRHITFWEDGYVFSRSIPELLVYVNLLCVVVLWLKWWGWQVTHDRRPRSASLAFLVPAVVLALVSWDLHRSMDFSLGHYEVRKMKLIAYSDDNLPPVPRRGSR